MRRVSGTTAGRCRMGATAPGPNRRGSSGVSPRGLRLRPAVLGCVCHVRGHAQPQAWKAVSRDSGVLRGAVRASAGLSPSNASRPTIESARVTSASRCRSAEHSAQLPRCAALSEPIPPTVAVSGQGLDGQLCSGLLAVHHVSFDLGSGCHNWKRPHLRSGSPHDVPGEEQHPRPWRRSMQPPAPCSTGRHGATTRARPVTAADGRGHEPVGGGYSPSTPRCSSALRRARIA